MLMLGLSGMLELVEDPVCNAEASALRNRPGK
jgi:hypothetical protein